MRQYNAFCTPAGIFLGMALWDIMRSLYLLMSKSSTAYKTAIWRAATATWVCLALFYLFQFMLLDFLANPYGISSTFFGYLLMLNFFLFYWTSFGIALMDMIRIRIFYAQFSKVHLILGVLFTLTIVLKGVASIYGLVVGLDICMQNVLDFERHPLYKYILFYLAIGQFLEAIFFTCSGLIFFNAVDDKLGKRLSDILKYRIFKSQIFDFIQLFGLYMVTVIFGTMVWYQNGHLNHITRVVNFLPLTVYSIQLHSFLKHSYVTTKAIIEQTMLRKGESTPKHTIQSDIVIPTRVASRNQAHSPIVLGDSPVSNVPTTATLADNNDIDDFEYLIYYY